MGSGAVREGMEAGPAVVPDGLLRHPSYLLSKLAAIGRRRVMADLAAEDPGAKLPHNRLHHFAVLHCLADFGPVCQRRIGEHLAMDGSDLVAVLDDLERAGWVERERDQRDRRRQLVSLAPAGSKALHQLDDVVWQGDASLLEPLTATERELLHDLLLRALAHHNPRVPCDLDDSPGPPAGLRRDPPDPAAGQGARRRRP